MNEEQPPLEPIPPSDPPGAAQENGDGAAGTTASPEPGSTVESSSSPKDAQPIDPVPSQDPMAWLVEHWRREGWDYDRKSGELWCEEDDGFSLRLAVINACRVVFTSDYGKWYREEDVATVGEVAHRLSEGKVGEAVSEDRPSVGSIGSTPMAPQVAEIDAVPDEAATEGSAVIPFPCDALPPLIAEYISTCARSVDCDPAMVGLPFICSLAAAIGNSAKIRVKEGFEQPAVVWGMVIAESGSAKSPAADHGLRPLRSVNAGFAVEDREAQAKYRQDKLKHDQAIDEWRKSMNGYPPEEPKRPVSRLLVVNTRRWRESPITCRVPQAES